MLTPQKHRQTALAAAVLVLIAALLVGVGALALVRFGQATHYPGATQLSDQALVRYTPSFAYKRTSSYRASDPFPSVYSWYSTRFRLGPERYGLSNCILMARTSSLFWVLEEQMSVTVCTTPSGPTVYVMRTMMLPWSRGL